MPNPKLTAKQEAFCVEYVKIHNASEAYRRVYNAGNMSQASIQVQASELLRNRKLICYMNELKAESMKDHKVTVDSIAAELEEARILAIKNGQTGAAVSASMGKAKLYGMLTDKTELSGDGKASGPVQINFVAKESKTEEKEPEEKEPVLEQPVLDQPSVSH